MNEMTSEHEAFMRHAIALAYQGMAGGHGGPFGAVIVKDGEIIGQGHNRVLSGKDPTAHAEMTAIRDAAKNLQNFDLSGTAIFVNAMPCPMCMSAIFWARIGKVYYAATAEDTGKIGFDDDNFYKELEKPTAERKIPAVQVSALHGEAVKCYQAWMALETRTSY